MNIKQAKNIRIEDYLAKIGYKPVKEKHGKLWYLSPIREENTSSFKVDTALNTRYDFGLSQGGDLIKFIRDTRNTDTSGALKILNSGFVPGFTMRPKISPMSLPKRKPSTALKLRSVQSLHSPLLLAYLKQRRISSWVCEKYLVQVGYETSTGSVQKAIGFKNDADGYEFRKENFKGMIGNTKSITSFDLGKFETLVIFEGFFDFLAFCSRYEQTDLNYSFVILNGVYGSTQAIKIINKMQYSKVILMLDNDEAGRRTSQEIRESIVSPDIRDMSAEYEGYKDYSAMREATQ